MVDVGLGTDQVIVNHALHRLGIPARPSGIASHPQMITLLDDTVPSDIRAAVEGGLHGWHRLHRFQIAMAFPSIDTAANYLGAHPKAPSPRCSTACTERAGSPVAPKTNSPGSPAHNPDAGPGRRRTYYALTSEGRRAALHELHHRRPPKPKRTNRGGLANTKEDAPG